MSEELMIRHCAPTMASLKTGNMFCCTFADREDMQQSLRTMNLRLGKRGIRLLPLRYRDGSGLVYVYRPQMLDQDLRNETACRLLQAQGYPCQNASQCLRLLMQRLSAGDHFPHEIGLFLGYPPEDVEGFMNHPSEAKCCGIWKVYGDVDKAQQTFRRYRKCTSVYLSQWKHGVSMEQLTVKQASN